MASTATKTKLTGLVRKLVTDGLLQEEQAAESFAQAKTQKIHFVPYLVENQLITPRQIALSATGEFGIPLFDLDSIDKEAIPVDVVNEKIIIKHHALPIYKRGNRLYVAISDPTNLQALDEIRFNTGISTEGILVEEDKLTATISHVLEAKESESLSSDFDDADLENIDIEDPDAQPEDDDGDTDDAPIVRFVNKLLLDAIRKGASDLHFEPYEKKYRVRYRVDGILQEVASPPINLSTRIAARLKVMSRLDISEKRVPQDGRIKLKISKNKSIDFRVSTLPTLFGEKIVMRILDPTSAQMGIEVLGYEDHQKQLYLEALSKPQGMILVTGPTGSGKTVSLYTGVNILNKPDVNISTAEDPVEINLTGINQVNVNVKQGMTFAKALRAFLRQDPDIVLVGEIRDLETAEIAIKAAQTGHLVLSTLHTNNAPETLTRLANMGVPAFNIATSVHLIIAQRLARRLCKECKRSTDIPNESLIQAGFKEDEVDSLKIFEPIGCDKCSSGYKGRVGVYEVMPITKAIARIIMSGGNAIEIADQARLDGVNNLRESGLEKVRQGLTSLAEINRITQD
ncbi:MAG: type IV-A pilus assembly ATPase PilB [Gammaproteobacteria bacterium]|nr:MAG: type IV-A pilus assembly ATPase PilB [Gammaproteobacteria bacterium]